MLVELVDIVGDAPPGLILAKPVRKVDVDRLAHLRGVVGAEALFKPQRGTIIAADANSPFPARPDRSAGCRPNRAALASAARGDAHRHCRVSGSRSYRVRSGGRI